MRAYSSSNKQTLRFPRATNGFGDPLELIYYQVPHSVNMDATPPTALLLDDFDVPQDEVDKDEI